MHTGMTVDFEFEGNTYTGEITMMRESSFGTTLWIASEELLEPAEIESCNVVKIYD
jgi:hypothetical protein